MPALRRAAPLSLAAALAIVACGPRSAAAPAPAPQTAVLPHPAPIDPSAPLTADQLRWVDRTLASLTLRERVGQMVNVWVLGDYSSDDDSAYREVIRWIEEDRVGGMTMSVGSPIEVAVKLNALQRRARVPLLVGSDLEPGLGRLEGGVFIPSMLYGGSATVFPNAMAMGAAGNDSLTRAAAEVVAREARAVGIHVVFGPVADVNNNPANPVINTRSFGESPQDVARHTAAFVRGLQAGGALATAKHFPGHGDTDTDSHLALPVVKSDRAQLDSVELVPFRAAIGAGVSAFMTAHIALPAIEGTSVPATLAPRVVHDLLRDTLGFRGLTYTDALTMEAVGEGYPVERSAVLAVLAGADVLLKPSDIRRAIDAVVGAVERGDISAARIDSSARRMLEAKARAGLWRERLVDLDAVRREVGTAEHWRVADEIATRAITLLRDSASLVPLASTARRVAVVTYAPPSELRAGRAFAAAVRGAVPNARVVRIAPLSGKGELDSLAVSLAAFDAVIVTTHVRTIEGAGRFAVAPRVAQWIDSLATRQRVIVVANGNPYVIRQFPRVGTYLVTYGVSDALERAAARAVLGLTPITGRAPISLPGVFARGAGLTRPAVNAAAGSASAVTTSP
ncbi:MAG TPA: glycoside hydrolase family 3 N-terminal domain-containing protein [Gemmatimonadaceae bacterium]|nr:glycoside hydrolase family 3 N-terminal domain-containing protein [Gemmatimonadaceae bacterium]